MLANHLKKGDTIGIITPSKPFDKNKKNEVDEFIKYMNTKGINIVFSKNFGITDSYGVFGGTPKERAEDINIMFSDNNIQAVWCLQGGQGANQVLDFIDFENIKKNPKLFLGKSDIDILLLALYKKTGLITFHCCDAKIGRNREMDFDYTKKWFEKRLFEKSKIIQPSQEWTSISSGKTEGKIIGCNPISILALAGTEYFPDFSDNIFFLETYKSSPRELLTQLSQFKQLGVFEKIKGMVIGNNYDFQSKIFNVENIIKDYLLEYNLPILKINEFGHYQPHAFLPIGAKVFLDTENKKIEILEDVLV